MLLYLCSTKNYRSFSLKREKKMDLKREKDESLENYGKTLCGKRLNYLVLLY